MAQANPRSNVIAGPYKPVAGDIFINERRVTGDPEHRRAKYIGRIFQNPLMGTAGNMSLEDNMMICLKKGFKGPVLSLNHKLRAYFRDQLRQLDMGLENRLGDNVGLFSGGQRQALTLLMMVLSKPDLVLLDEHTAALDPKNAELVLALTERFIKEYRLTTMMITHNMSHALKFGNRLLMMDKGEIILDVAGERKKELTVEKLVEKFHELRHREFATDKMLLAE
jgi:putative ABC transport system ATP-binding protein